ncbi:hypothetical protein ACQ4WY_02635 [Janthinobacterium sp. LB2P49]|uniref:hypothetical protein n=1 Tax=Janthinobacterium sp. LB2P49 TaxID=3424198 RepID=UPI003F22B617
MANHLTRFDPFSDIARFEPLNAIEDWLRDFQLCPAVRDWNVGPGIKVDVEGGIASVTAELKHEHLG